jgi:hypothetical protein
MVIFTLRDFNLTFYKMSEKLPWILLALSWASFSLPKDRLVEFLKPSRPKLPWILLFITYTYLLIPEKFKQLLLSKLVSKKRIHTAKFSKPPRQDIVPPFELPQKTRTENRDISGGSIVIVHKKITDMTIDELMKTLSNPLPQPHRFQQFDTKKQLFQKILPLEGWETQSESGGITIRKLQLQNLGLPFIRGDGMISKFSLEEIASVIINPFARKVWDQRFDNATPLEFFENGDSLVYSAQKGTFPVAGRDFLTLMDLKATKTNLQHVIASVEDSLSPESDAAAKGLVRGQIMVAGWDLKKEGSDVKCSYIVHVEPNGNIPNGNYMLISVDEKSTTPNPNVFENRA